MRWHLMMGLLVVAACDTKKEPLPPAQQAERAALREAATTATDTGYIQALVFGKDTVKVGVTLSHHTDSVTVVDTIYRDSIIVVAPPSSGVDTAVKGDTTLYAFWSMKKVVDSTRVVVKPPPTTLGKLFGPTSIYALADNMPVKPFTIDGGNSSNKPEFLMDNIADAYRAKTPFIAGLPCVGGHNAQRHGPCLRDSSGVATFYPKGYDSLLAFFNTQKIKDTVRKAYRDGILIAINLMDEPWVSGGGDGNTWGPKGTISKARIDSICVKAKAIFPEVPVGTSTDYKNWEPSKSFKVCDVGLEQYGYNTLNTRADLIKARDSAQNIAKRGGYANIYSFNIINGGSRDKDGTWDCAQQGGHKGQRDQLCQMTPTQIIQTTQDLGEIGCGAQIFWRYDKARFAVTGYSAAFDSAAKIQLRRAAKPCKRR